MFSWLPPVYKDVTNYFVDVVTFLHEYKWIYNWNVTHILCEKALDNLPDEWLVALQSLTDKELNKLHSGNVKEDWPESLKKFLKDCQKMRVPVENYQCPLIELGPHFSKGLSPKKQHEVVRLAKLVHSECSKADVNFVLDIGSGLGYLCEILHFAYGHSVLGLECDPNRTATALKRHQRYQMSLNKKSYGNVFYATCHLSPDSVDEVHQKLLEVCGSSATECCLVGLHACGDLTSSALHLFHKIPQLRLVILLPCCYHKMLLEATTVENAEEDNFKNFPLSDTLREAVDVVGSKTGCKGSKYLRRPFLRLAAQRSSAAWETHEEEQRKERLMNTLATASLYLFAHQKKAVLKKTTRRGVRRTRMKSLDSFLSDAIERYEMIPLSEESDFVENSSTKLSQLRSIVDSHKSYLTHISIMLALQGALQPVAESLVLADFTAKLVTCGYSEARLLRLTDQILSPRGVAIIANKPS